MQLAETLGIGADERQAQVVDTDSVGFTNMTGRQPHHLRRWLGCLRAGHGDPQQDDGPCRQDLGVRSRRGHLRRRRRAPGPADAEGKDRSLTFKQLAAQLPRTGGTIEAGVNVADHTRGPAFAGHIVDVEVDPDTGKVDRAALHRVPGRRHGHPPGYVEGQIQGGVAQGIGMALTEGYYFDKDGRMHNNSFLDYRMPTTLDVPMIETVLVENPNPGHPYGVRGVGEVSSCRRWPRRRQRWRRPRGTTSRSYR